MSLSPRAVKRVQAGQVWIHDSEIRVVGKQVPQSGEVVRVEDPRGRVLGRGFYSEQSKIRVRLAARGDAPVDDAWWEQRLSAAIALRERLLPGEAGLRLVNAEGDGMPGLIVDRYGPVVSMQLLTPATDARRDWLVERLLALPGVDCIVDRGDAKARRYEGLPLETQVLAGEVPAQLWIDDGGGVAFSADPVSGQKTGAFLDQRPARRRVRDYAAPGMRCLDLFSYHGGFGMQMAAAGARVTSVDISLPALRRLRATAEHCGLSERIDAVAENVFDFLTVLSKRDPAPRFDLIVLDPPAFAPNRAAVRGALRGYKDLNLRALKLLAPGGVLVTCSCSAQISGTRFREVVADAAADAGRALQLLERYGADVDHPPLLALPQTHYLDSLFVRVI